MNNIKSILDLSNKKHQAWNESNMSLNNSLQKKILKLLSKISAIELQEFLSDNNSLHDWQKVDLCIAILVNDSNNITVKNILKKIHSSTKDEGSKILAGLHIDFIFK